MVAELNHPSSMISDAPLADLVGPDWDAVVIGAGPAGATAAATLQNGGMKTLLVDRGSFPRQKVCGGCLAPAGAQSLIDAGLGPRLAAVKPLPLSAVRMCARGQSARLPIKQYVTIERGQLDQELAAGVVDLGGTFLGTTKAQVAMDDSVTLERQDEQVTLTPRVVVVADGISGTSLSERTDFAWDIDKRSPLGLGAVLDHVTARNLEDEITMRCGRNGYVGAAPLADGRWVVAAALSSSIIRREGPGGAVADVLRESGEDPDIYAGNRWKGVGHLTRRRRQVASGRVMLVGDSAGYVEPLTGEGMSWGICCAAKVLPFAERITGGVEVETAWARASRAVLRPRRMVCRTVCGVARHPHVLSALLRVGGNLNLTRWATRRICWSST